MEKTPYMYSGKLSGKYKLFVFRPAYKSFYYYDDLQLAVAFGERLLRSNGKVVRVDIRECKGRKLVWSKTWETMN